MDEKSQLIYRIIFGAIIIAGVIFMSFKFMLKGPPFIKVLAIGLIDQSDDSGTTLGKARWILMDVYQGDQLIESCWVHCDVVDGVTSDCCHSNSGDCYGLEPRCGPPLA